MLISPTECMLYACVKSMKHIKILYLLLTSPFCFSQAVTPTDSLLEHLGISDSIVLITTNNSDGRTKGIHSNPFIDFNKNSMFHSLILKEYGCECLQEELYNSGYAKAFEEYENEISADRSVLLDIKGHWIPIRKYQSKFYLYYADCEYNQRGFTLSDSTVIEYYMMDGPYPSLILNTEENDGDYKIKTNRGTYELRTTIEPNIFIAIMGSEKMYVIHERFLNDYPVIGIHCHELGGGSNLLKFGKVIDN